MRRFAKLAIVLAACGLVAAPSHVHAQAGADGGVIGKQNRSVTGSDNAGGSRSVQGGYQGKRRPAKRKGGTTRYQGMGGGGGSGNVRVQGNCVSGSYAGYSGRVCY